MESVGVLRKPTNTATGLSKVPQWDVPLVEPQAIDDVIRLLIADRVSLNQVMKVMGSLQWFDILNRNMLTVYDAICILEFPPTWTLQEEEKALRSAASGPGNWCVPGDLWTLNESFGLAKSSNSLACLARAAQLRVFACDQAWKHGVGFSRRAADL